MTTQYGRRSAMKSSNTVARMRWHSHLAVDVPHAAEVIREETIRTIKMNADKGRGSAGSFRSLSDNTIERYERDPGATAYDGGSKSKMQRSGRTLAALEGVARFFFKGGSAAPTAARVVFSSDIGKVYPYVQNAIRKWLALSTAEMKKAMAKVIKSRDGIKVKRGRPPGVGR